MIRRIAHLLFEQKQASALIQKALKAIKKIPQSMRRMVI